MVELNLGVLVKGVFLPYQPSRAARLLCRESPIIADRKTGNSRIKRKAFPLKYTDLLKALKKYTPRKIILIINKVARSK